MNTSSDKHDMMNYMHNHGSMSSLYYDDDLIGGAMFSLSNLNLDGRKQGIFESSYIMYVMADMTDPLFSSCYFQRLSAMDIPKSEQVKMKPHITMMEVHINKRNSNYKYIVDSQRNTNPILENKFLEKYYNISPQMYMSSNKNDYAMMGEYFTKKYNASNPLHVTEMRMVLYKYLEGLLGQSTRTTKKSSDGTTYYIYSYEGKELIGIPEYYHGKGVWEPHLSFIKMDKLYKLNPYLHGQFRQNGISILTDKMKHTQSIDNINMAMHFNRLRISTSKA
jgi:hypothetical protein